MHRLVAAIIAEMIAAALNTNGLHWDTSPAVAELEQVALGWLRQWMGLPDNWFGIIYDTASVSSFHAICAAREYVVPESRVEGSTPNLVLYTSSSRIHRSKRRHRSRHRTESCSQDSDG